MSTSNNAHSDVAPGNVGEQTTANQEESKVPVDRIQSLESQSADTGHKASGALTIQEKASGAGTLVQASRLIYGNRPIGPSEIKIDHTMEACGTRPVAVSTLKISEAGYIMGKRPIAASILKVSDAGYIMGKRPIASNESEETPTLMGFID